MEQQDTQEFRNTSDGQVGAIKVNRRGEEVAIAVGPGERIKLTVEEQELTAGAASEPSKSPFQPQEQVILDPETGDPTGTVMLPLLEPVTDKPDVPGIVGDASGASAAPQGQYAPGEAQGTPV